MTGDRPGACLHCGADLAQAAIGRPREYCDQACRQAAHRARNAQAAPPIERPPHTPQPLDVPDGIEPNAGFPRRGTRTARRGPRFPKATLRAGAD